MNESWLEKIERVKKVDMMTGNKDGQEFIDQEFKRKKFLDGLPHLESDESVLGINKSKNSEGPEVQAVPGLMGYCCDLFSQKIEENKKEFRGRVEVWESRLEKLRSMINNYDRLVDQLGLKYGDHLRDSPWPTQVNCMSALSTVEIFREEDFAQYVPMVGRKAACNLMVTAGAGAFVDQNSRLIEKFGQRYDWRNVSWEEVTEEPTMRDLIIEKGLKKDEYDSLPARYVSRRLVKELFAVFRLNWWQHYNQLSEDEAAEVRTKATIGIELKENFGPFLEETINLLQDFQRNPALRNIGIGINFKPSWLDRMNNAWEKKIRRWFDSEEATRSSLEEYVQQAREFLEFTGCRAEFVKKVQSIGKNSGFDKGESVYVSFGDLVQIVNDQAGRQLGSAEAQKKTVKKLAGLIRSHKGERLANLEVERLMIENGDFLFLDEYLSWWQEQRLVVRKKA